MVAGSWKPMVFGSAVAVSGGMCKSPVMANSTVVDGRTFLEVSKSQPWVTHVVCGKGSSYCPLKRTTLLERLREAAWDKLVVGTSKEPAPAGGPGDADDPMGALGVSLGDAAASARKRPRRRAKNEALEVPVQRNSGETTVELDELEVAVSVWLNNISRPTGRQQSKTLNMWILLEDVPHVMKALITQYENHGVPELSDGGDADVTSAPADGSMWYDFRDRAWIIRTSGSKVQLIQCGVALSRAWCPHACTGSTVRGSAFPAIPQQHGSNAH